MLSHLRVPLAEDVSRFNLFRYLTFRSGGAVITALTICFLLGPRVIDWLRARQGEGQPIRDDDRLHQTERISLLQRAATSRPQSPGKDPEKCQRGRVCSTRVAQ